MGPRDSFSSTVAPSMCGGAIDAPWLPAATFEEQKEDRGLVAKCTGWVQNAEHGYVGYTIETRLYARIGDADDPEAAHQVVGTATWRYSAFLNLSDRLKGPLGVRFRVPKQLFKDAPFVKDERVLKLPAYINECLRAAQARSIDLYDMPEELRTFLGIPEDAAVASVEPTPSTELSLLERVAELLPSHCPTKRAVALKVAQHVNTHVGAGLHSDESRGRATARWILTQAAEAAKPHTGASRRRVARRVALVVFPLLLLLVLPLLLAAAGETLLVAAAGEARLPTATINAAAPEAAHIDKPSRLPKRLPKRPA